MKLTAFEEEKIKALMAARESIVAGHDYNICSALPDNDAGKAIREFIMMKLNTDNEVYYHWWAIEKFRSKGLKDKALRHYNSDINQRSTLDRQSLPRQHFFVNSAAAKGRTRWIDAMIKSIRTRKPVKKDWE